MEDDNPRVILDGSYGSGTLCEITIITKSGDGEKEETYFFPYAFIDFAHVQAFDKLNLIKGYRTVKQDKPSALKELGL